jgi:hypothetical protein
VTMGGGGDPRADRPIVAFSLLCVCINLIDMFLENCAAQLPDWTASCSREPQYIHRLCLRPFYMLRTGSMARSSGAVSAARLRNQYHPASEPLPHPIRVLLTASGSEHLGGNFFRHTQNWPVPVGTVVSCFCLTKEVRRSES